MEGPLDFTPHHLYGWSNRFDDPSDGGYRTLYAADERRTALREVLQDLRPNAKMRTDFQRHFGTTSDFVVAGTVTWKWRSERALAPASIVASSALADFEDAELRRELETVHAGLLDRLGMKHIDANEARSKVRVLTQTVGKTLHDDGYAGVVFRSGVDNGVCFALFEGRGHLNPVGKPEPLTANISELVEVCSEFDLVLRRASLPASVVRGDRGSRLIAFALRVLGRV